MMLTQLARVLRDAGLKVVEVDGWKTRGHGQMTAVRTITCHHTANGGAGGDRPSLDTVKNGRPGLDGPLSQLFLSRNGTWYVVAAGVCWHAGASLKTDYDNWHAIGIEAEAEGTSTANDDWPKVQMDSYARGVRALVEEFDGVGIDDVRGHKETCEPKGRKVDPSFSMPAFRTKVSNVNLNEKEEDDDMPLNAADKEWLTKMVEARAKVAALDVWRESQIIPNQPLDPDTVAGDPWTPAGVLSNLEKDVDNLGRAVARIESALGGTETPPAP